MQRPIISIIALLLAIGCDNHDAQMSALLKDAQRLEANRAAVLVSASESVAFAREFDQLFSGGHKSAGEGRFGWDCNFEVGLYGRYVIQGRVPLTVDTNTMTVLTSSPPVIYISEIGRILTLSDGRAEARFTTNQAQFGAADWRKLVESHGDFSVVGYGMVTNTPLTNFDRVFRFPGSLNK
jgi:hypothetical protein